MFVFISALSAGRHDATFWSLYWMSASALKSNITQLCTFLLTFTFVLVCFKKKKSLHKEASIDYERNSPQKKPARGL